MTPLNQGQVEAADFFFSMLFDDSIREMSISGGAGYGKTFLMGYLINEVMPRYHNTCKLMGITPKYNEVVMTATTNKAAEQLSLATGRHTGTCHSYFSLVIKDNYQTGENSLQKGKSWSVHQNKIIFIDEAYYIDSKLRNYLLEGTQNCKLIYVGDKDQMAPVKEKISPVADPRNKIPTIHLTEPMRNAGKPALVSLCSQLRANVETLEFQPILAVPGVIDYLSDEEAEHLIQKTFDHQNQRSRILCFHNARVNEINNYIRHLRALPMEYQEGEYLINNSSIRSGKNYLSVEQEVYIDKLHTPETILIQDDPEYPVEAYPAELTTGLETGTYWIPVDREYVSKLTRYFKRNKMWRHFYQVVQTFPDLRPRDACTVYKAQGSTLDSVFIDLTDISKCGVADTVARMLYVGASRARENVYFFGELNPKFGKIIQ